MASWPDNNQKLIGMVVNLTATSEPNVFEIQVIDKEGPKGNNGRPLELNKSETHVQWRYVGDAEWIDLISLSDIKGNTGPPGTTSWLGLTDKPPVIASGDTPQEAAGQLGANEAGYQVFKAEDIAAIRSLLDVIQKGSLVPSDMSQGVAFANGQIIRLSTDGLSFLGISMNPNPGGNTVVQRDGSGRVLMNNPAPGVGNHGVNISFLNSVILPIINDALTSTESSASLNALYESIQIGAYVGSVANGVMYKKISAATNNAWFNFTTGEYV